MRIIKMACLISGAILFSCVFLSSAGTVPEEAQRYMARGAAEQEITREEALDIFGSLSDTAKWDFRGENSAYKNWIRSFKRDGDRIAITYIIDIHALNTGITYGAMAGNTNKLKLQIYFDNFYWPCPGRGHRCDGAMGVLGQYDLEIISRQRVVVNAVESYPQMQNIEAQVYKKRFEYIRK
jgi:hypothetical protein